MSKVIKTEKQKIALRAISDNNYTLLEGGSRSGKTFIVLYGILARATLKNNTNHLIVRHHLSHARMSICQQTMPKVVSAMGAEGAIEFNRSSSIYKLTNGSQIWVHGLDDKERAEKILGNEFDTIFMNEASQIGYDTAELLMTRLNPSKGIRGKLIIDYNPPSVHHWGYKIFHTRKFPDGRPVPEADYAVVKMNPADNLENLSEQYLEILNGLSGNKKKRFLDGEYTDDTGSLWKRNWIKYNKDTDQIIFKRIAVGVDPTGTKTGDEAGIIVAGVASNGEYYILDDYSLHGTPKEWAEEVSTAYHTWKADIVVAEKNFGGDMVEYTLKNVDKSMNVKLVTATRGKIIRAEPISALYEKGQVYHRKEFPELEDEYCMYDESVTVSPNRLDASVWALTELSDIRKEAFFGRA